MADRRKGPCEHHFRIEEKLDRLDARFDRVMEKLEEVHHRHRNEIAVEVYKGQTLKRVAGVVAVVSGAFMGLFYFAKWLDRLGR
jgi:hypothetical protein